MEKSPDAFRTISEVAEWLDVPTHVLRFWESRFSQVKPVKRAGGRRYYRPTDMQLIGGIKKLLHEDGMTIRSVQKLLREEGVRHVASFSKPLDSEMGELVEASAEVPAEAEGESDVIALLRAASQEPAEQEPTPEPAPEPTVVRFGSVRHTDPELPFLGSEQAEAEPEPEVVDEVAAQAAPAPETDVAPITDDTPAPPSIPDTPDVPGTDPEDDDAGHARSPGLAARILAADRARLAEDGPRIEEVVEALRALRDRSAN